MCFEQEKILKEKGVDSRPFFYPVHMMPSFKVSRNYPIAENISKRGINLPSSVNLKKDMIERIVDTIKSVCR